MTRSQGLEELTVRYQALTQKIADRMLSIKSYIDGHETIDFNVQFIADLPSWEIPTMDWMVLKYIKAFLFSQWFFW